MSRRYKILWGAVLVVCILAAVAVRSGFLDRVLASGVEAKFRHGVTLDGTYTGRFDTCYFFRIRVAIEDETVGDQDDKLFLNWSGKSYTLSAVSPNDLKSWGAKPDSSDPNTWRYWVLNRDGNDLASLLFVFAGDRLIRFALTGTSAARETGQMSISVGDSGRRAVIPCRGNEAIAAFGEPIKTTLLRSSK